MSPAETGKWTQNKSIEQKVVRVLFTSAQSYDRVSFDRILAQRGHGRHQFTYTSTRLEASSAALAGGHQAVCSFVNDDLSASTLERLSELGVRHVALRCAGSNNVDLKAASRLGLCVVSVPAYGPDSVAEFTVGLLLCLARRLHRSYNRIRENNFDLSGLVGFQLKDRTAGIVGTGNIGAATARLLLGFGMKVLASDPVFEDPDLVAAGVSYTSLPDLLERSDVISLHCPLLPSTHHLINADALKRFKPSTILVNTSRGALLDTGAVIKALKAHKIGGLAIDVYEGEHDLFFKNHGEDFIVDDVFERLKSFPNVLITGHQAFLTHEALATIAEITLNNLDELEAGNICPNLLCAAVA